jgi:myo-inositol-1(or 4)-monophosphatase
MGFHMHQALLGNFSQKTSYVASEAALLGAIVVESIYGTSPEKLRTQYKVDAGMSPVTTADWQSQAIITQTIKKHFPTHQINAEEAEIHEGQAYVWYVDPLDGTTSFIKGQRYSTIGVSVYTKDGSYVSAAIVNPFERELLVAERGNGAFLFTYDSASEIIALSRKIAVSNTSSLRGCIAYVDASFNYKTTNAKLQFIQEIALLGIGDDKKGKIGLRMTGSNIDQQRQVAVGRAEIGLTDAIGGPYDWRSGYAILSEAGGVMLDVHTGKEPTDETLVVVYGNEQLMSHILPIAQIAYRDYRGFK